MELCTDILQEKLIVSVFFKGGKVWLKSEQPLGDRQVIRLYFELVIINLIGIKHMLHTKNRSQNYMFYALGG